MLQLAKDPNGLIVEEVSTLMHQFYYPKFKPSTSANDCDCSVQVGHEDEVDDRDIELDQLNENYFSNVFKSLLYSKERRIIYRLLDIINFYIKHETPV